jgi:hypothetical protein
MVESIGQRGRENRGYLRPPTSSPEARRRGCRMFEMVQLLAGTNLFLLAFSVFSTFLAICVAVALVPLAKRDRDRRGLHRGLRSASTYLHRT